MTLSILVPTTGRPCLSRLIESVQPQLGPDDQLLIKHDHTGDWGHTPRNEMMALAKGDYILSIDDDDVYLPGALWLVRWALAVNPGRPHLFRLIRGGHFGGDVKWTDREVRVGNVGTQMIVAPNDKARLGRWGSRYEGDYDFIVSTLTLYPPDSVVWREEAIAVWRPAGGT